MNWTPSATRADVVRMIARYVRLEYSIRSTSGRMIVDESRIGRKRLAVDIDLEGASDIEVLDAISLSLLRRAIYAPPEKRRDVRYASGELMRCVAPLRDVVGIVKPKSKLGSHSVTNDVREWRATVSQKLARLGPGEAPALLGAERIRLELRVTRNQLAAARSEFGRLRGGGRQARNLRRYAELRVADLHEREAADGATLKSLVRTTASRRGVDRLLMICTETAEIEAYCFRTDRF